jgi:predicted dehydrogenase
MHHAVTSRITPLSSRPSRHHDRVAIVGCGNWGKNLVRNFNHLGVLSALCDLNPEAVAAIAAQYEGVDAVTDYQAILDNPIIAGVVLATPSITHYPLAKQALLAGKHVYVEKPAATRPEEVDELETLAAEKKLTLMVGHLLLYHRGYQVHSERPVEF